MYFILVLFCLCVAVCPVAAKDAVNFTSKPLAAGKALIAENGYIVSTTLGTANFSPELRLPIQLAYYSSSQKTSMFGYGWQSPQLESSSVPQRDGVLWMTPWGETIRFYAKHKTDKEALELFNEPEHGSRFFSPFSDWVAACAASGNKFAESGDWTFSGKRGYAGWSFVYRKAKLTKIRSSYGNELEFAYAQNGSLSSISQNGRAFVEFSYSGPLASLVRINGIEHVLAYKEGSVSIPPQTENGKVAKVVRPRLVRVATGDLNPVEFAYDECGYLVQMKQGDFVDQMTVQHGVMQNFPAGIGEKEKAAKLANDVCGRIVADSLFSYSYPDAKPGRIRMTNKLGQTASYEMNAQTGVFKLTEFSGKRYSIYYFMRHDVAYLGKVRQIVDSRKRTVVSYRYDKGTGKPVRVRDMAGNDIVMAYDASGNLVQVSRRGANESEPVPVSRALNDPNGRPVCLMTLDANGKPAVTTRIQYDASGRPVRVDNGQMQNTIVYNGFGYPTSVRNVFGQTTRIEYDAFNRAVSSTNPYGVTSVSTLSPSGLVSKMERKDGNDVLSSVSVTYDGNGLPVSYIDHRGRTKTFERDAFGRVVKEFLPDDTSVEYSYNAIGQVATVLDQNKNKIAFDWDRFGLGGKTTAAHQLTDYVYDESGMLSRVDSSMGGNTDRSIQYEYDNLDRISRVTYADKEVETFKYDSWGKILETTRGGKKAVFKYDFFGRLVEKTEGTLVNRYAYNAYGQRTARSTVDGDFSQLEERSYDAYGRLTGIKSGKDVVAYQYNDKNQLAIQIVNGTFIRYEYTKYGQLKKKMMDAGIPDPGADEDVAKVL